MGPNHASQEWCSQADLDLIPGCVVSSSMALQNGTALHEFTTLLQAPNSVMEKCLLRTGPGSDVRVTALCLWGPRKSVLSLTFPGGNETSGKVCFQLSWHRNGTSTCGLCIVVPLREGLCIGHVRAQGYLLPLLSQAWHYCPNSVALYPDPHSIPSLLAHFLLSLPPHFLLPLVGQAPWGSFRWHAFCGVCSGPARPRDI